MGLMIPKRKVFVITLVASLVFIATTNYLLLSLSSLPSEDDLLVHCNVHKDIYKELARLPQHYKKSYEDEPLFKIDAGEKVEDVEWLWKLANSWIGKTKIVDLDSPYLGSLMTAMKTAKVTKADVDSRGTQLKLMLTLDGGQEVIFKPKWYDRDQIIEGPVHAGKDRWSSEIIAFYLSALLKLPFTPVSVARRISLGKDVVPVATQRLLETTLNVNNRTCTFGKCYYCTREKYVCDDSNYTLTGVAIFNMNVSLKMYNSPWRRTYKKNKKAPWEISQDYCKTVRSKLARRRILDLVDISIFDFLIQNGDRHHYETLYDNVIMLDNGKGFGNPTVQHLDVLAPLYQCCNLRSGTLKKLQKLAGGTLRKSLEVLPDIKELISAAHLNAIEERLLIVFATIEYCRNRSDRKQ